MARKKAGILQKFLYKYFPDVLYRKQTYSQSGEDILIQKCLDMLNIERPTFIDVGANHPFHFNNTALFYKKGSKGINIEPNAVLCNLFNKHRKKDLNLNIGISDEVGEIDYFEFSTPTLNTCSEIEVIEYQKLGYVLTGKRKIKVYTLNHIIDKYHNGLFPDILSIDVEGLDENIIKSIDLKSNYPKVICIESVKFDTKFDLKNKLTTIIDYLEQQGYQIFADTYVNTILIKF